MADFVAKKRRLGVDQWGSTGRENPEVTQPIQDLVAREAPDFDPYPWGRFDWVRTLVLNIALRPAAGRTSTPSCSAGSATTSWSRSRTRSRSRTAPSARAFATS